MRGEIIYRILSYLGNEIIDYVDFSNAFIKSGYGASSGKIKYEHSKLQNKRVTSQLNAEKVNKFKKYLSKLKSEGLVLGNDENHIYLSDKGKKKLNHFQNSFSLNKDQYKKKAGERVIVVSYDIPVAFNKERNILRDMLNTLGFSLVHKSVWIGKVLLPLRFIADLSRLGIIDYVEILEVTKNGTIKAKN